MRSYRVILLLCVFAWFMLGMHVPADGGGESQLPAWREPVLCGIARAGDCVVFRSVP